MVCAVAGSLFVYSRVCGGGYRVTSILRCLSSRMSNFKYRHSKLCQKCVKLLKTHFMDV